MDWQASVASALDWWREAGVDLLVDDAPRDWLARAAPPPAVAQVAAPVAAAQAMPATLAEFEAWRLGPDAPEARLHGARIGVAGVAESGLMILTDMPDRGEAEAGVLLDGPAGRLFDRMLAAIGRDRASVYLVPLCNARPVTGRIDSDLEQQLRAVALHHVALAAPRRLLLLGDVPARALAGEDAAGSAGGLRTLNHHGGKTQVVATMHPRLLLGKPALKAQAWKELQMLIEGADL